MGEASKTEIARRLYVRPEGATKDEVMAATGDYQYRALKQLEGLGYRIERTKEGRLTRYRAIAPVSRSFEAIVTANGKMTIPRDVRDRLRVREGGRVRLTIDGDDRVTMTGENHSVRDLFGALGKPARTASSEDIDEAARYGAVRRYLRSGR